MRLRAALVGKCPKETRQKNERTTLLYMRTSEIFSCSFRKWSRKEWDQRVDRNKEMENLVPNGVMVPKKISKSTTLDVEEILNENVYMQFQVA